MDKATIWLVIEVADVMPKGSSDLMEMTWEETEATSNCALEGWKRYQLVTMKRVAVAKEHH